MKKKTILMLLLLVSSTYASAAITKCVNKDGQIAFTSSMCPDGYVGSYTNNTVQSPMTEEGGERSTANRSAAGAEGVKRQISELESEIEREESKKFVPAKAGERVHTPTYNQMYGSVATQREVFERAKADKIDRIMNRIKMLQNNL
ncbi:MAG: DUF4124 domain-containing protein [Actinobacteria bacterium]|nr:DUF4124 domain-containing protein [Actinomycetota bacterium]